MAEPTDFGLRDECPGRGWHCTCGADLDPACDISAVSVAEEFMRHLTEDHGFTRAEVEEATDAY